MIKKLFIGSVCFLIISLASNFFSFSKNIELKNELLTFSNKSKLIIIDKEKKKLNLYDYNGNIIEEFTVGIGTNPGNKLNKGDLKTPEGIFPIIQVQDSKEWKYDFEDDNQGPVDGAYGPYFLRLKVDSSTISKNISGKFIFSKNNDFTGIGIHGTHIPESLGNRNSHGCIRINNDDLLTLKQHIYLGMNVVILPGKKDILENLK